MKFHPESLFIYPTDTVWGIGASIYSESAYRQIATIKQTGTDKPLSIMFTDIKALCESFNFPDEMTVSWLVTYFGMESTLGIPLTRAKISIPSWVTAGSDVVSVRCLNLEVLKPIGEALKVPFFTTSLNVTSQAPIISYKDAFAFQKEHAPAALFFGDSSHNLSGRSSTIIFLRDGEFKVIREGARVEEIKKHLSLTRFIIS